MFETKTAAETEKLLQTGRRGLTEQEAEARLKKYGANEMEEKRGKGVGERFLSQLMDPLIYVLVAAGVVSILLGEAKDAAIIAAVVLLNAAVGVIQEGKAQKALEALKKMTRLTALVMRDGNIREIDAAGLVPGDLVFLEAGRQVPADLRLTVSENLQIEEAALTGESLPAKKDALFLAGGKLPGGLPESGIYVLQCDGGPRRGPGYGHGDEYGDRTDCRPDPGGSGQLTPLQKRLGDLGGVLSMLALVLCGACSRWPFGRTGRWGRC